MPEICIVIPCFNEEHRLPVADLSAHLDAHPDQWLCLVDDGSTDKTFELIERMRTARPERILVHRLRINSGKAEAVRAGIRHATSLRVWSFIGYWDADLSTPLEEVDLLLAVLRSRPGCVLAMGSRVQRLGASVERRISRHVLGRIFATCAVQVLGFPVYDSQCGAKLFRADHVELMFGEPFLSRWLFDLEILVRLRNAFGAALGDVVREIPVERWRDVGGSKLRLAEMINVPREFLRIWSHYRRPDHVPVKSRTNGERAS
jgi:glycosyltransferase involved in cell wall biosynthesis